MPSFRLILSVLFELGRLPKVVFFAFTEAGLVDTSSIVAGINSIVPFTKFYKQRSKCPYKLTRVIFFLSSTTTIVLSVYVLNTAPFLE